MAALGQMLASLGEVSLSLEDWLVTLRRRGRLQPLLSECVVEHFLIQQARQAGLDCSADELQAAADLFRRRHGLTTAAQTNAWLAQERRSILDFEAVLKHDLLIEKLKDHLTHDQIANHFAAHGFRYDRIVLRQIVVPREDMARELLTQLHEGAAFKGLARQHSAHTVGAAAEIVLRGQLSEEIAAPLFAAETGSIVGPIAMPGGFRLFLIEACQRAELDVETRALIRAELFNAWLQERLREHPPSFPLLDALA